MSLQLSLSLTSSHVQLGTGQVFAVQPGQWRGALAQVLSPFEKADAQVQLGFNHARVALMTVDLPDGLSALPAVKREGFIHAWCAEMLHVMPQEQIVRWRALADPRHVLVSCVRREIAEDIEQACKQAGVRLASCRPAVLSAMDAVRSQGSASTIIVWTEGAAGAARHGTVQMLRFRGHHLTRSWRGWVTTDVGLEVARFAAAVGEDAPGERMDIHWPPLGAA